jgi:thiamine biosynthesis lipoprotein
VLLDPQPEETAELLLRAAAEEALRIERKFSRYRTDSVVHAINAAAGKPVPVDEETARLLDFADRCHRLSDGLFDVTSGVLRRVWTFDGSDRVPDAGAVEALLPLVGWEKVRWTPPAIALRPGMELDLGGIGKEYAVDCIVALLAEHSAAGFLVNLGGDLRVSGPRSSGGSWIVGIEDPDTEGVSIRTLELGSGALATSGDARRYLVANGRRLGHILDPRTGRPVEAAPRSVTVLADTCTGAGFLATLAMLHGAKAEAFLAAQGVRHWCFR